jgi:hypothetical protein
VSFLTKILWQNTTLAPPHDSGGSADADDLARLEQQTTVTPRDQTAAALEQKLQHETELRKEERFFWIFLGAFLLDIIMFKHLEFSLLCWPLLFVQLIFLIGIAGWLGVERVAVPLERLLTKYLPKSGRR